ncbi:MAG: HRDC domain-containing protein [Bacteroides sp.]|nr:HRDC domain-containing protein [Bacteroides sp.]
MNIKIFDISAVGSDEGMETLNKFLRGHKVLDIDKQFYVSSDNIGHWSVWVSYLPAQPVFGGFAEKREKVDYKAVLGESDFVKFTQLRLIRKQLAEEDAVPAYAVFTDAELALIAQMPSIETSLLRKITGIGEKRIEKYGRLVCERYAEGSGAKTGMEKKEGHEKGGFPDGENLRGRQLTVGLS